ncbi:hypothetical protein BH10ACI2_BH10ACI2_06880 [soil metagenome]
MKNIINWNYERASWQWDVLCLLILAFIFFTPKEWFNNERTLANQIAAVVVQSDDCGCEVPR